ncbi:MAG: SH3 domain-containing protein [Candidatus Microgenomates bacterium]|jgi:putative transposase
MPAKYSIRVDKEGAYFHISNRGVSEKIIFKDGRDYEVFLGYLKDYLTPPAQPNTYKKTFTVKGRTFRGVPHLTKNYFNKVDLIAYNLMPNHFHLLLHQITQGSLEKFMRSLCTRYSMYFNKRHQNAGALFAGPYKSVCIEGTSPLLLLTRYFHHHPGTDDRHLTDRYSSYAEYLGKRETSWVKPNVILSFFNNSENKIFKGVDGYRNFIEKYEPDQNDKNLLEGIILEKEFERLGGSNPILAGNSPVEEPSKAPEFAMAITTFVLLFAFGFRNVWIHSAKATNSISSISSLPSPPAGKPAVAGVKVEKPEMILAVKINDGSASINIRRGPTLNSEKVGEAKNGDTFEFVAINSGWFGVRLADGSTGFIWSKYIEIMEDTKI